MFYVIRQTSEDKRLVREYWEEVRRKTIEIRDSYDRANENKFHNLLYGKIRPDFMEPLPKNFKKK